ncbi:MAG: 16S rRNA (cytidine(1402)-2'-O)-methyltransferase [Candidatus Hydrogenedentes bacterium]|nr:16S rRNA (cytidine(1402)-2'-O)-methyltransferase [Candidatus Hydrogenedentota bacterium]
MPEPEPHSPTLYVIATPIGNLEDITLRALRILGEVDALACEDTRMTRRIFERHAVKSPRTIFSYHEHNEPAAGHRILGLLESGQSVALTTDGGYPGISDPGYRIIAECRNRGFRVEVIPGPSAVTIALVASGLPTSSFTFKGFPPRKPGPRKSFLAMDKDLPHSLVFFESPFRVGRLLQEALEVLGNRLAAVCIELTKKFEEVHRGYLADLAVKFNEKAPKGEITIVIAGSNPKFEKNENSE